MPHPLAGAYISMGYSLCSLVAGQLSKEFRLEQPGAFNFLFGIFGAWLRACMMFCVRLGSRAMGPAMPLLRACAACRARQGSRAIMPAMPLLVPCVRKRLLLPTCFPPPAITAPPICPLAPSPCSQASPWV